MIVAGWDIGAVNVKAALWLQKENDAERVRVASQPLEIWRDKDRLAEVLQSVWDALTLGVFPQAMAATMTAELSDAFVTKREGVLFVLQSLYSTFPGQAIYIFNLRGEFVPLVEAFRNPLDFAASNWLATAKWVAMHNPNCMIVDVGSTTTDVLPIVDGEVRVVGRTDLERLSSGELVYTGALRTNLAALVSMVPVKGRFCRVASEYFAISGDVHLILGELHPEAYTCPTPDGQPVSVDAARRRLARLVCADTEVLSEVEIDELARYLYDRQVLQICAGIEQVMSRLPCLRSRPAIALGSGCFLGKAAAKSLGLEIGTLAGGFGAGELAVAPCVAVAQLLALHLGAEL